MSVGNVKKVEFNDEELEELNFMNEAEKNDLFDKKNAETNRSFWINLATDTLVSLIFLISIYIFEFMVNRKINEMNKKHISAR